MGTVPLLGRKTGDGVEYMRDYLAVMNADREKQLWLPARGRLTFIDDFSQDPTQLPASYETCK